MPCQIDRQTRSTKALTKRYGVIFACLTTRAIHIELAGDLSTDSFLLALRKFISRRGYVKVMRSDNGTNFVGANNELNLCIKQLDQINLHKFSNHQNPEWIFNPPASPWMGRLRESLVKSVKNRIKSNCKRYHIYRQKPPNISLRSGISFKWTSLNLDQLLTPKHSLIGEASSNQSPGNFGEREKSLRRKWRSVRAATEMLTIRRKWNSKSRNFKVGDLVKVMMKDMPRSYWPMRRVLETWRFE